MERQRRKPNYWQRLDSDIDYQHRFEDDYDEAKDEAFEYYLDHAQERD